MSSAFRFALILAAASGLHAEAVTFRQRCLDDLIAQVPALLRTQDAKTGRFGSGIWIVTDQNLMLPLAAAWSYQSDKNPYYHSAKILDALMIAGDALMEDQDETGQWVFRKKDGSTWGKIYMPWTYSRWIRTFQMIREAMPAERRAHWEKGLLLGYTGIAKSLDPAHIQNIPAHHAMGLYFAAEVFKKPEWKTKAADYLHAVVAAQHSDGYWSENKGPVVNYGFVYVDAVGTYYAASHDASVLPALRKSGIFHYYFTYPDGSNIETVDERNPYHGGVAMPNVGFAFTPEGRSYIARQLKMHKGAIPADAAASLLLWGEEGDAAAIDVTTSDFDYRLPSGEAAIRRRGPWFLVVAAMTAPVPNVRWIQDRQNFASVFHEKAGLILGGGNTKLQPSWSNFTIGDISSFFHRAGDENPKFQPPAGVVHLPSAAKVIDGEEFGVDLDYQGHHGRVLLAVKDPEHLEVRLSGGRGMTGHLTLLPRPKAVISSASGQQAPLTEKAFTWSEGATGQWIELNGVRVTIPVTAMVRWPLYAHDPYKKDGKATIDEARVVIDTPATSTVTLEVRSK